MSLWGPQTAPSSTCHTPTVLKVAEIKHKLCQSLSQTGSRTSPNASATGAFPSSDPATAGMMQRGRQTCPCTPERPQSYDTPRPFASLASHCVPLSPEPKLCIRRLGSKSQIYSAKHQTISGTVGQLN